MKLSFRFHWLLASLLLIGAVGQGSVPPHPSLKARIASGAIARPYYLENLAQIRSRGVNAPWSAPALSLQKRLSPATSHRTLGPAQTPTGPYNALLILVDFSDNIQQVQATFFDSLIFGGTGSMDDYFGQVSYGSLDVLTVNAPSQIGWTRAPQSYPYYVNAQNGFGAYPNNAQRLVEDVVIAVDSLVDFSQYDNDLDGYVDAVFVVHAGPGGEFTGDNNDIWSHKWVTYNPPLLDSVLIYTYSMEPEYWSSPGDMTIGVYAHEMGHAAFGLPDLYDRDGSSSGLGRWSLMAGGSWNGNLGDSPAFPDAWSHIQMGYVTPTNIASNVLNQSIGQIETNAQAFRLWTDGIMGNEYFLVENRQQVGYDAALPGSGLLVYHIDEAVTNQNDDEWYPGWTIYGHYLVALEQADGFWDLEQGFDDGDSGDPFPGTAANTTFDAASTPDSRDYGFAETKVYVTNISSSGGTMYADLGVTEVDTTYPVPINLVAGNGFDGIVPLTWDLPVGVLTAPALQPGFYGSHDQGGAASEAVRSMKTSLDHSYGWDELATGPVLTAHDSVASYKVYRADTTGGPYTLLANVDPHNRPYGDNEDHIDDTVTNGLAYYYVVTAIYGDGTESGYSSEVIAGPIAGGHTLNLTYTFSAPTIDGYLDAGEWLDATVLNMAVPGVADPIQLYMKNDGNYLYIAADEPENISDIDYNVLAIYFDDDNSGGWDPGAPSSEGNFWVSIDSGVTAIRFRSLFGEHPDSVGFDSTLFDPVGVSGAISLTSGHMQYETRIDLSQSVLTAAAGDTIGLYVFTYDYDHIRNIYYGMSGAWPFGAIWVAPRTYAKVVLSLPTDPPVIAVTPDSLSAALFTGETSVQTLTIGNVGLGSLIWDIGSTLQAAAPRAPSYPSYYYDEIPKGTLDGRVGSPVQRGSGGPDGFGYSWIDSDDPGGPAFSWMDISATGTLVSGLTDDSYAGPFPLGFTLSYYGTDYTQFYISSNGYLGFGPPTNYNYLSNEPIPSPNTPNNILAWCWDDLHPQSGAVYYQNVGGELIVQFVNYGEYAGTGTVNAEVIIRPNGTILYQYLNFLNGFDVLSSSVGIENSAGTDGLQVLFNAAYLHDALAVRISPQINWLTFNPTSGSVAPGDSVGVDVTFDAAGLAGGAYDAQIVVASNDTANPQVAVPAHLQVTGAPDIALSSDSIDFGQNYVGYPITDSLFIFNLGTDSLTITALTIDAPFTMDVVAPLGLNPGDVQLVSVTFDPAAAGAYSGALTVTSDDPDEPLVTISLQGNALNPPVIAVTPDSLSAALFTGDSSVQTLTIDNIVGGSDLNFEIMVGGPAAAAISVAFSESRRSSSEFARASLRQKSAGIGYRAGEKTGVGETSLNYHTYIPSHELGHVIKSSEDVHQAAIAVAIVQGSFWTDSLWLYLDGLPDVSAYLIASYDLATLQAYDVVIHYGNSYFNAIALTDFVNGGGGLIGTPWILVNMGGLAALPAEGYSGTFFSAALDVTVTDAADPILTNVNFVAGDLVGYEAGVSLKSGAVSPVMWADGSPAAAYWQYGAGMGIYLDFHYITSDTDLAIWYEWGRQLVGNAVYMAAGQAPTSWLSLEPTSGMIPAGSSLDIAVTFDATGLAGGDYDAHIVVASNDPVTPEVRVPAHLNVTGLPDVALEPDSLDFGDVFVGIPSTLIFTVFNEGTDSLLVSNITTDNAAFTVSDASFVLYPGEALDVSVTLLATSGGAISSVLTVSSNDPDEPAATIALFAVAALPPVIAISPDSMSTDLFPGQMDSQTLTISNLGTGDLHWSAGAGIAQATNALPASYYDDVPKGAIDDRVGAPVERGSGGPDSSGYTWIDSDDPGGPAFDWMDISATGTPVSGLSDDSYVGPFPLGFTFSYYGTDYTEFYISSNGYLGFGPPTGYADLSNDPIPSTNTPNNILAWCWDDLHPQSGAVYYQNVGGELIVQFVNYGEFGGSGQVNAEVIIRSDGTIIYQYLNFLNGFDVLGSSVGIEDSAGTDGLQVSFNTAYLHDALAIRLSRTPHWLSVVPASGTVAPSGSQDVTVNMDATGLEPGIHHGQVTISSNDPLNGTLILPVSVRVPLVGAPAIIAITDVPQDQGGWVRAAWQASSDDRADSPAPVLFYSVWLRDEPGAEAAPDAVNEVAVAAPAPAGKGLREDLRPGLATLRSQSGQGESVSAPSTTVTPAAVDDEYPVFIGADLGAGGWTGVGSIGATQDAVYSFMVPTLGDSNQTGTRWSYIRVSAHTSVDPSGYAFSQPDSGYSVDNIAPGAPANLVVMPTDFDVQLSWSFGIGAAADFQYFAVYRGTVASFTPLHADSSVTTTTDTVYADEQVEPGVIYYYRVAAVDYNGNFSELSEEASGGVVGLVAGMGLPDAFALRQNYPNPFNPSTTIRFDVPEATHLTLIIYDILGREVTRLRQGAIMPGYHQVVWNGRTAAGREATTGLYIVRLVSPAFTRQIKMVLMK